MSTETMSTVGMWSTAFVHVSCILAIMIFNGGITIYMLRKVLGHLHLRLGPTELGPAGIAQLIPDILKLLVKEDRHPNRTDYWLYCLAPAMVFMPVLAAYAALPFSETLIAADIHLGLLMTLGFVSLVPLGVFAAGYASRNKYALIGAMRAIGGSISYEIPLILACVVPVMLAGSLNLREIVLAQQASIWFVIPALPSAIIFFICALMETGQVPFDMAESESELISGFSTEYSAMRFGFMYLAEFSGNFVMAAIMVSLFLGGWTLPFVPDAIAAPIAPVIFVAKCYLIIFCFMVVRGTLSRYRVDQFAALGFKKLIPITLIWTLVFAIGFKVFTMWGGGA
ncbi:MAG: NADH-quinone oxidoreductase subunit H [Coriobacteriia bacterium]|nr:NADH-quinone oxidoreductase subunit H [Coriobacteriia bacterium]